MDWPSTKGARWTWARLVGGLLLVVLVALAGAAAWYLKTAEPRLRREFEVWLSARLNSDVTLESMTIRLVPSVRIEGTGMLLRVKDRPDLPPFITIRRWTGSGLLTGLRARRLEEVRLEGVELKVPPGRKDDLRSMRMPNADSGDGADDGASSAPRRRGPRTPLVDRLVADAVTITVLPKYADRDPVVWDVRDLEMESFSVDGETPFTATVDTPLPNDRAKVTGRVGPWPMHDYGQLPLSGSFTFAGDLGAVPGMTGELTASGDALGTLERIAFNGVAGSNAVGLESGEAGRLPLNATFEGVLDGTNGDVFLTRLTAALAGSAFETSGEITRVKGVRGRHLALAVKTPDKAEVGDLMRLLIDGERPPMSGRLTLEASIDIPPGEADVLDRLTADGRFGVSSARFIHGPVQERIDELARRGQGRPKDTTIANVRSELSGRMTLRKRGLSLTALRFTVPGASIDASGTYGLASERMRFRGVARLDASMSRTQTGAKRVLLRPLDPLLRKDGAGTRIVLDIRGSKRDPKVDLDLGATLRGRR